MTQDEYITILFLDNLIDTTKQRKAFIQKRFDKEYIDELTSSQKSLLINELKDMKSVLEGSKSKSNFYKRKLKCPTN